MRFWKPQLILLILLLPACAGSRPLHTGQLGQPLELNGVRLTVLHVRASAPRADGTRSVDVDVVVKNVNQPTITLAPKTFQLVDTTGARTVAEQIIYDHPPADLRILTVHQTDTGYVRFTLAGGATAQALHYTPFLGADRMEVPIAPAAELSATGLDLLGSGAADVPPPEGWHRSELSDVVPEPWPSGGLPVPDVVLGFLLTQDTGIGMVHILGYPSGDEPLDLFNRVVEAAPTGTAQRIGDVGERAVLFNSPRGTTRQLNFTRCQVHVMLQFIDAEPDVLPTDDEVIAYAQRLDAQLQPDVCS